MKRVYLIGALLLAILTAGALFTACAKPAPAFGDLDFTAIDPEEYVETEDVTEIVRITVQDRGDIYVRLYPEVAPKTVENFQELISEKFYDGLTFHRVIEGFMIQGGDPKGDGTGGSEKKIKGEFSLNGFQNNLKHIRGVISMAREGKDKNSASSQFFIVHKTSTHLNGSYASFGYVVSGMDVVDAIAVVPTDSNDKPLSDVVITSIRFVTKE